MISTTYQVYYVNILFLSSFPYWLSFCFSPLRLRRVGKCELRPSNCHEIVFCRLFFAYLSFPYWTGFYICLLIASVAWKSVNLVFLIFTKDQVYYFRHYFIFVIVSVLFLLLFLPLLRLRRVGKCHSSVFPAGGHGGGGWRRRGSVKQVFPPQEPRGGCGGGAEAAEWLRRLAGAAAGGEGRVCDGGNSQTPASGKFPAPTNHGTQTAATRPNHAATWRGITLL